MQNTCRYLPMKFSHEVTYILVYINEECALNTITIIMTSTVVEDFHKLKRNRNTKHAFK